MKKLLQKGFGAVELLLVVTIIGIIGGVGYYIYSQIQKNDDLARKSNQPADDKPVEEKDETADWLIYESPGKQFKVKLADGWKMTRYLDSPAIFNLDNQLAIVPGQKAVVTEVNAGRDFATGFSIGYSTTEELNQYADSNTFRGTKGASLKTDEGLTIDSYHFVQDNPEPMLDVPPGGHEYVYIVSNDKGRLRISYSFAPGQTDYHKEVEKILPSIHIQ